MRSDTLKSDWNDIKKKIKTRFDKLTDESVESLKGNLELLSARLQKVYGYAKEQADKELSGFKASLHLATEPAKKGVTKSSKLAPAKGKKAPIGRTKKSA